MGSGGGAPVVGVTLSTEETRFSFHIFQFEVDVLGRDRHWRVRNINEALKPANGRVVYDTKWAEPGMDHR